MKALVVHESMYGNTAQIAQAIVRQLRHGMDIESCATYEMPASALDEIDLLIIGGPTHAHGMSRSGSRLSTASNAVSQEAAAGEGVREFLEQLPKVKGISAAAFDTRLEKPGWLVGSAARGIAKRLKRHGYHLVAPPESFFVTDSEGPLKDGELERAAQWADSLIQAVRSYSAAEAPEPSPAS